MKERKGSTINSNPLSRVLSVFANAIDRYGVENISKLLSDNETIISFIKNAHIDRPIAQVNLRTAEPIGLRELEEKLRASKTREEGIALLEAVALTRRDLEFLARQLRISVLKSDNIGRLSEKVIEATIGARLNSAAIRGSSGEG